MQYYGMIAALALSGIGIERELNENRPESSCGARSAPVFNCKGGEFTTAAQNLATKRGIVTFTITARRVAVHKHSKS